MGNSASSSEISIEKSRCKERIELLKKALERRSSLIDGHTRFNTSLKEVAEAIKTFVEKQKSPTTSYIVQLPDGLQFLQALELVGKQFRCAYESNNSSSKMLEANNIENKSKLPKLLRSLSRSSSRVRSTYEESESMGSTLEQLKLWEKKLHEDLKVVKSEKRLEVIIVFKRSAENNSKDIIKLRDEHLLPKLVEQINCMMQNWEAMSKIFQSQKEIMSQVADYPPVRYDKVHQKATENLKGEVANWCPSFASYTSSQTAYFEFLLHWLSKTSPPTSVSPNGDWLRSLKELKNKVKKVTSEMKGFQKNLDAVLAQQRNLDEKGYNQHIEDEIKENNEILQEKTQQAVIGFSKVLGTLVEFSCEATRIYRKLDDCLQMNIL